jgi:hypothetical protein
MARRPYFSGNYGSALAQVDTRPIMQGAAAQAAMYQGLGQNIGGAIEKYQLNKVKRAKLTGDIEAYLKENPDYANESTMTGDEAVDKKNMTENEKFLSGDLNMAGLEGLAGKLARGDTLRKNRLLEESQMMQNKMQELTYGINKELRDTKVNIEKDRGVLSRLFREREEEQDPEKRELFSKRISETLANFGMGDLGRKVTTARLEGELETIPAEIKARKVTAEAVPGQVESATAARKRADDTAKALLDAMGGPEGVAAMTVEEKNLNMNKISAYINYMDRQGKASVLKALAGTAPPSVTKQAAMLSAFQGDLLGYKVRDPINGGQISFEKYLELNNSEGDSDYPLTGDNAGTAGRINATFLNSQKQIDDLVKTVKVQVNVPGAGGGASASGLPPAVTPDMTPVQANEATGKRTTVLRNRIFDLQNELTALGTAPESQYEDPYLASIDPSGPHSIGHITSRQQEIPAEITALEAELAQLAMTNY